MITEATAEILGRSIGRSSVETLEERGHIDAIVEKIGDLSIYLIPLNDEDLEGDNGACRNRNESET